MEWVTNGELWAALFTLTALEIVLGIDNIVFISILASKLEKHQQAKARFVGLALAMISRIALLFSLVWVMSLTKPLFELMGHAFSGRDLILIGGGLFLLGKSTKEIHEKVEEIEEHSTGRIKTPKRPSMASILVQILILDIVFSLDSVITAVGMVDEINVMIAAVMIAVGVMMLFSGIISKFIDENPALKVLALSFLLLIGFVLCADGFGQHIPKGYIYSAMAFSVFVEFLNVKMRTRGGGKPAVSDETVVDKRAVTP